LKRVAFLISRHLIALAHRIDGPFPRLFIQLWHRRADLFSRREGDVEEDWSRSGKTGYILPTRANSVPRHGRSEARSKMGQPDGESTVALLGLTLIGFLELFAPDSKSLI
jgi:hypothetical protein